MTEEQIPETVGVAIEFETSEEHGLVIEATLGGARIIIQHDIYDETGARDATILVGALPGIMDKVAEAIANQEEP